MNQKERHLLREEFGNAEPDICIRSKARIDAGRWWRRTPVWLCIGAGELVMLAVSRRKYFARMPVADCSASHYNHATGELVIEPGEDLQISRFPLSPRDAIQLLNHIKEPKETC